MRRLLDWLRARVLLWLGHDPSLVAQLGTLAEQNAKMAAALHQIVAQLNRNTTTMQRWAEQSATLGDIERRHARREAMGANGHSNLVLPPGVG